MGKAVGPFYNTVVDHDTRKFSVHGPHTDDVPLSQLVDAAQKAGRNVNIIDGGLGQTNRAKVITQAEAEYPNYLRVCAVV